jgi:hypothetical protein
MNIIGYYQVSALNNHNWYNFVSGKRAGDSALLDKYFCNGLAQKEKRPDIDIHHIVPILFCKLNKRRPADYTRVVYQNINCAKLLTVVSTISSTQSFELKSAFIIMQLRRSFSICCRISFISSMSTRQISAPASAKPAAIAWPKPLAEPVQPFTCFKTIRGTCYKNCKTSV